VRLGVRFTLADRVLGMRARDGEITLRREAQTDAKLLALIDEYFWIASPAGTELRWATA